MSYEKICFLASDDDEAQEALRSLRQRHGDVPAAEAEVIVALGGDGFMLATLHDTMDLAAPVYGMNRGTVGFLMNEYHPDDLPERLAAARRAVINPLRMVAYGEDGRRTEALALNEVSPLRQTRQAATIRLLLAGEERLAAPSCAGIPVAPPAGRRIEYQEPGRMQGNCTVKCHGVNHIRFPYSQ